MKKFLRNIFIFFCLIFFVTNLTAQAAITSKEDIKRCISKMEKLADTDFTTLLNRNEVIGQRRDSYEMITYQYIRTVRSQIERFNSYVARIEAIENNYELSDTEKSNQIQTIYNEAHMSMFDLDTRSANYIFQLRDWLPSITYQKYGRSFMKYYNSFDMTERDINLGF